jgi:hypothetical protein
MSFGVDASQNYRTWGNTEAIVYTSHSDSDYEYAIAIAKPRAINFKELAASGGAYIGQDRVWLLPAALVSAAGMASELYVELVPKAGDWLKLVSRDGLEKTETAETGRQGSDKSRMARWTVLEAGLNTLKSTWRLVTRNLAIVYELQDVLTVKRPTFTTDAAGGRTYTGYTTVYQYIACRFQETQADVADERGQRLTVKRYTVPVEQRLILTIEDQLFDRDGNVYEVKGWHDADRIDQLQQIECERRWT